MHTGASYGLLLLSSKFNLLPALEMDLGPLTMFSLMTCVILNLSVESTEKHSEKRRFASLFSYFCSSQSPEHRHFLQLYSQRLATQCRWSFQASACRALLPSAHPAATLAFPALDYTQLTASSSICVGFCTRDLLLDPFPVNDFSWPPRG